MPDYRELWSSLGVDLQKHDQLCAALPDLYGRVFLTDDDRPQGMNYFTAVVAEIHGLRIQELAEHRRAGGKVLGTFCVFVPEEVILAADAVAVGLCSGSHFWVPDGERVLPRNTCPLIKASLGAALGRTCPYFLSCDLLVGETTCDGKKKTWEILAEYLPVHVMHLPQMKRERDVAAWKQEIGLFLDRVQQLSGRYITAEGLGRAIRLANQKRGVLRRLYEAPKAEPVPINGKDALLVSQIAFFDDPARFVSQTEVLCRELEARIEERRGALPRGTPRILVTGTPMAIPNWKLHHVIESSGGAVVCEETCTGTRYFENPVSEDGDTIEEQLEA
ncbi:MAG TPA: 2-hydroxyacyl-CoA dehydratase, partial [Firmicutes bacterium]|nr:2-hydroxyacyl-CoA dehydratase [Bacillota bacterium]